MSRVENSRLIKTRKGKQQLCEQVYCGTEWSFQAVTLWNLPLSSHQYDLKVSSKEEELECPDICTQMSPLLSPLVLLSASQTRVCIRYSTDKYL